MLPLRRGRSPSNYISLAAYVCLCAPAVMLSGCASDRAPSYVQGPTPHQLAAMQARKVEMEDDGQPVQPPPARPVRAEEDDPSQPWSPNYGGNKAAQTAPPASPAQPALRSPNPYVPTQSDAWARPTPQPAGYNRAADAPMHVPSTGSLTRLSEPDADLIMAQAINAQEMRRR